jgi:hypothetical protein
MAVAQHQVEEVQPHLAAQRERDRQAILREVRRAGFEHALESLGNVIAVLVVPDAGDNPETDTRMAQVSAVAETAALNALVWAARSQGWSAPA